jgi:hypothetical protein
LMITWLPLTATPVIPAMNVRVWLGACPSRMVLDSLATTVLPFPVILLTSALTPRAVLTEPL